MADRLTSKGTVSILVLLAASTTLISGSRQWVSGTVDDVVLGSSALHGTGSDLAPGVMAAALVGMASVVVAATSGRVLRILAVWATLLAAVLGVALVVSVLADPQAALGGLVTAGTGRRGGAPAVHGQVGGWAWVAFAAMLVMAVGALAALAGGSRWSGLPSRYDGGKESLPPTQSRPSARRDEGEEPAGATEGTGSAESEGSTRKATSAWDQLSRGEDPTL